MTRTAVVILNYNGEKLLRQFLPSVINHSSYAEIIVADNGSTDESLKLLKQEFPEVRVISLGNNYGFCGGYNRALSQIDADYYVLLNSDVEVTANWLLPLQNLLNDYPDIAAVQPKILSYRHRNMFEYAGAGGGLIDSLGYPFCRGRLFDYTEIDQGQYDDTVQVFWASGACMMIRASAYHHFGGLDEDLFAHMEEIDLCWKVNRTNDKIFYCGASTVYHVGAGTLGYESPRKTYLNFRNGLVLLYKHLDTPELLYKLPLRLMLDWLASINFMIKGRFKSAGSVFRAHYHFLMNLANHRKKRRMIRANYPTYSRACVYKGSAILDFFLLRKRVTTINNPK